MQRRRRGNHVGALSAHLFMMPYGTGEKEPAPWKNSEESWFFRSPGRQSTSTPGDEDKVERRMSPRLLKTNQRTEYLPVPVTSIW